MSNGIDYELLLRKYIEHVGKCEGTYFIHNLNCASDVSFTNEEVDEMNHFQRYPYEQEKEE